MLTAVNEQLDQFLTQSITNFKDKVEKVELAVEKLDDENKIEKDDIRSENDQMETEDRNSKSETNKPKKTHPNSESQSDKINKDKIKTYNGDTRDHIATEDKDTVEVMSDTESSSSEEFIVVGDDAKKDKETRNDIKKENETKLVIVPEKVDDCDDLFSDIFEDRKDFEKLEEILSKGRVEDKKTEQDNKIEKSQTVQKESMTENRRTKVLKDFSKNNDNIGEDKPVAVVEVDVKHKEEIKANDSTKENTKNPGENKHDSESFIEKNSEKEVLLVEDKTSSDKNDYIVKVATEFKVPVDTLPKLSVTELQEMKDNLQREKIDLLVEKSTKERLATNISDQMYQEAQVRYNYICYFS